MSHTHPVVISHEHLGNDDTDQDNNRNLYVLTYVNESCGKHEIHGLAFAADDYLTKVGIINHPDIYIERIMRSVKINEFYVVLNMDMSY